MRSTQDEFAAGPGEPSSRSGASAFHAYHPLVRAIVTGLRRPCGVDEAAAIVVAVSGGADSVALLRALHALASRRTWRLRLIVGHVQHHLRDAAERDAHFVAALADQLRLPCERLDIHPLHHGGNVEATARRQRYAALARIAQRHGAGFIATAHHADDQLETMLMRLVRGTGPRGLRGIAWRRAVAPGVELIRPMLRATHAQAMDYLAQLRQPWREDESNADRTRLRARVRAEIVPVLRAMHPRVALHAVALGDQLRRRAAVD